MDLHPEIAERIIEQVVPWGILVIMTLITILALLLSFDLFRDIWRKRRKEKK